MVCPFSAVHDISTAEAFIKQHGSSIVLKGSSAVLEFELQVFRDNAQGAMAEVRRGLRIGASLLIEKYIGGNEFTQYCFTDGFNSFFPKVVRDFPFRSATSHQKTGGMGSISFGDIPPDITPVDTKDAQDYIKMALERLNYLYGVQFRGVLAGQFINQSNLCFSMNSMFDPAIRSS